MGRVKDWRPADRPYGRASRLKVAAKHVLVTQIVMNLAILVLTLIVVLVVLALGTAAGAWATFLLGLPMVFGLKLLMAFVNPRLGLYSDESWGIEIASGAVVFAALVYLPGVAGQLHHAWRAAEIDIEQPQQLAQFSRQAAFYRIRESTALEALKGSYTDRSRKSPNRTYEVRPLVRPGADVRQTLEAYRTGRECAWLAYEHRATWTENPALGLSGESPYFIEIDAGRYRLAAAAALKLKPDGEPACSRFYVRTLVRQEMAGELWQRAGVLLLLVNLAPWVFFLWVLGHVLREKR